MQFYKNENLDNDGPYNNTDNKKIVDGDNNENGDNYRCYNNNDNKEHVVWDKNENEYNNGHYNDAENKECWLEVTLLKLLEKSKASL